MIYTANAVDESSLNKSRSLCFDRHGDVAWSPSVLTGAASNRFPDNPERNIFSLLVCACDLSYDFDHDFVFMFYWIIGCSSRSSVSEELLMGPSMSVCQVFLINSHDVGSLLEHIVAVVWTGVIVGTYCYATVGTEAIVGTRCYNNWSWGHCWNTLLKQWDQRSGHNDLGCRRCLCCSFR
jgi:hypothetical protein